MAESRELQIKIIADGTEARAEVDAVVDYANKKTARVNVPPQQGGTSAGDAGDRNPPRRSTTAPADDENRRRYADRTPPSDRPATKQTPVIDIGAEANRMLQSTLAAMARVRATMDAIGVQGGGVPSAAAIQQAQGRVQQQAASRGASDPKYYQFAPGSSSRLGDIVLDAPVGASESTIRRRSQADSRLFELQQIGMSPRDQRKLIAERLQAITPEGGFTSGDDPFIGEAVRLRRQEQTLNKQRGLGRFATPEMAGRLLAIGAGAQVADTLLQSANTLYDSGRRGDRYSIEGQLAGRRAGEQVLGGIPFIGGALVNAWGFAERATGRATEQEIADIQASTARADDLVGMRRSRLGSSERRTAATQGQFAAKRLEVEQRNRAIQDSTGDRLSPLSTELNDLNAAAGGVRVPIVTPFGTFMAGGGLSASQKDRRNQLVAERAELERQRGEGNAQAAFELAQLDIARGDRNFAMMASARGRSDYSVQRELLSRRAARGDEDAPLEREALDIGTRREARLAARRINDDTAASRLERQGSTREAVVAGADAQFGVRRGPRGITGFAGVNRNEPGGEEQYQATLKAYVEARDKGLQEIARDDIRRIGRLDASRLARQGFGLQASLRQVEAVYESATTGPVSPEARRRADEERAEARLGIMQADDRAKYAFRTDTGAMSLANRNLPISAIMYGFSRRRSELMQRPEGEERALELGRLNQEQLGFANQVAQGRQFNRLSLDARDRQQNYAASQYADGRRPSPYTPQIIDIETATRQAELGLLQQQDPLGAARVRQQGQRQIGLMQKGYETGFRSQQFDARRTYADPRDIEDVAGTFRAFDQGRENLSKPGKLATGDPAEFLRDLFGDVGKAFGFNGSETKADGPQKAIALTDSTVTILATAIADALASRIK
jgi:hypothetical protein